MTEERTRAQVVHDGDEYTLATAGPTWRPPVPQPDLSEAAGHIRDVFGGWAGPALAGHVWQPAFEMASLVESCLRAGYIVGVDPDAAFDEFERCVHHLAAIIRDPIYPHQTVADDLGAHITTLVDSLPRLRSELPRYTM